MPLVAVDAAGVEVATPFKSPKKRASTTRKTAGDPYVNSRPGARVSVDHAFDLTLKTYSAFGARSEPVIQDPSNRRRLVQVSRAARDDCQPVRARASRMQVR